VQWFGWSIGTGDGVFENEKGTALVHDQITIIYLFILHRGMQPLPLSASSGLQTITRSHSI
jgi:hypothetical protein